jgi:hypothetical protein
MHETNQKGPPKVFPDLPTCRVKPAGFADYFDCLSVWACSCPHSVSFGGGHFCRHPSAREIFARSEDKKDKPA